MAKTVSRVTRITNCARCGRNHRVLRVTKFRKPPEGYTHWAVCPNSRDPILIMAPLADTCDSPIVAPNRKDVSPGQADLLKRMGNQLVAVPTGEMHDVINVRAVLHCSDHPRHDVDFTANHWLKHAYITPVSILAGAGWANCYVANEVAACSLDPAVREVVDYCTLNRGATYEVEINADDARAWVERYRPAWVELPWFTRSKPVPAKTRGRTKREVLDSSSGSTRQAHARAARKMERPT